MKAMVLREFKKPIMPEEVDVPRPGEDEVLIKVEAAGVCGTDLKIQQGMVPTKKLPLIPGHEVAGVVMSTGENVTLFHEGDEVLVSFYIPCNNCRLCKSGRHTICRDLRGRIGFEHNGGFAEYVAVPEACLVPKPEEISFQQAAVIPDALATCYHALVRRARVGEGDCVVMVGGGGGLGLHALQIAGWLGANVVGVDVSETKLRLMKAYGADLVIDGKNPFWSEVVRDYTHGMGADHVVEFICDEQSIGEGLKALGKGGKLVLVSYSRELKFDALYTHLSEIDILSTRAATKDDIKDCVDLVIESKVQPVIGEVLKLEELNYGLELVRDSKVQGRLVLDV